MSGITCEVAYTLCEKWPWGEVSWEVASKGKAVGKVLTSSWSRLVSVSFCDLHILYVYSCKNQY
jgi:hypothetical protein